MSKRGRNCSRQNHDPQQRRIPMKVRLCLAVVTFVLVCLTSGAQDEKKKAPRRFGFDVDETTFPQSKPEDAMKSIAMALDRKKVDYLLAHLVDPLHVDYW